MIATSHFEDVAIFLGEDFMKKFLFVFLAFLMNSQLVLASNNFINANWWKNATLEKVKAEIAKGTDINALGNDKTETGEARSHVTPLMFALKYGNNDKNIIQALINAGAKTDAKETVTGADVLMYAISGSGKEVIQTLIDAGADVNGRDVGERTVLARAVMYNKNPEVTKTLIKAGADVNAKDLNGITVLMYALQFNNNPKIIEMLIDEGADINAKDNEGSTTLIYAARNINPKMVSSLIEKGVDVNEGNKKGITALMMAATVNRNPKVLMNLIENGGDVNAQDKNGFTALITAATYNQNPEMIKTLIENGADVNATDKNGVTALMTAAGYNQNPEITNILIDGGANISVQDKEGGLAVIAATRNPNQKIHGMLLKTMNLQDYCKLNAGDSFQVNLCVDKMMVYAEKEYMLPSCTNNMAAMIFLTPLMNAYGQTTADRKEIGWLALTEAAARFNCSLSKTFYTIYSSAKK